MKILDLHGIRYKDVQVLIDIFLWENKNESSIIIITGNSINMKKEVNKILNEYNLHGKEVLSNSGRLLVDILI